MSGITLTDAPKVALPPLTKLEAETIASMNEVTKRYRLGEWIRCRVCHAQGRPDGCRSLVTARMVRIECRCGVREFVAPQGTSDLAMNRANSALTGANQGDIRVIDGAGQLVTLKAVKLESEDAAIVRLYDRIMGALQMNPKFCHRPCWSGKPFDGHEMEVLVNPSQVALKCSCSCFHYSGTDTVH